MGHAIGTERLRRFVGFMILSSVGTILIAIAMNSTQAWAGALYYMVHSTPDWRSLLYSVRLDYLTAWRV